MRPRSDLTGEHHEMFRIPMRGYELVAVDEDAQRVLVPNPHEGL